MQNQWIVLIPALLLIVAPPPAAADEPPTSSSPSEEPSVSDEVPCFYVDWTVSPPRVYEVPC